MINITGYTGRYPQNVGDPQNAGLGSGTSRQQNSHVEVNVLLSAYSKTCNNHFLVNIFHLLRVF